MKILLADDHGLVREAIALILRAEGTQDVVEVESVAGALEAITIGGFTQFDIILLDYDMPGMDGLLGLSRVKEVARNTPIAILTGSSSTTIAQQVLASGANGFLQKTMTAKALSAAIRFMLSGEIYVPYNILLTGGNEANVPLTPRERDVLIYLQKGMTNKEIGAQLGLQEITIKLHVKTLCRKVGAKNRTQAALLAPKFI